MEVFHNRAWKGGWFIGNFEPTAFNTDSFEVCLKVHFKGEKWPVHYHRIATEINYIIQGKMTIINQNLAAGDVFIIKPNEIADPIFLEDCKIIVVKIPCIKGDKYEI